MGRFLIFVKTTYFLVQVLFLVIFFGKDFVFKIQGGFTEKLKYVFFRYDLGNFTSYPPGRKKRKVCTRSLIEFSFNFLYMNIYTPEIQSFFFYDGDDDDDDDEPEFFVFKFLHTLTEYRSYLTIYVYKGKLCRKKVLQV